MKESKQFIIAYSFWVQIIPERLLSHVEVGFVKSFQDLFRDLVVIIAHFKFANFLINFFFFFFVIDQIM